MFFELIIIVIQAADMHQTLDENIDQFHEKPERLDIGDQSFEFLADLVLHELAALEGDAVALGLHGAPFTLGRDLAQTRQIAFEILLESGGNALFGQGLAQDAVHHQVGITAYG